MTKIVSITPGGKPEAAGTTVSKRQAPEKSLDAELPPELVKFAASTTGEYEARYLLVAAHAFEEYKMLLNSKQLRRLCGGGSPPVSQRAVTRFRESLHQRINQRLSASVISHWLDNDMPADLSDLSPKEKVVAQAFQRYVARLTLTH